MLFVFHTYLVIIIRWTYQICTSILYKVIFKFIGKENFFSNILSPPHAHMARLEKLQRSDAQLSERLKPLKNHSTMASRGSRGLQLGPHQAEVHLSSHEPWLSFRPVAASNWLPEDQSHVSSDLCVSYLQQRQNKISFILDNARIFFLPIQKLFVSCNFLRACFYLLRAKRSTDAEDAYEERREAPSTVIHGT